MKHVQKELFELSVIRDPHCTKCKLHKTAEYVCLLGQGPKQSDVMIIGEAPGKREDDSGKPFVGKSGQLLEATITEYGFHRKEVFITNAVSCRPPDNRTPSKGEIKSCKVWLDAQIKSVKPKFILLLGNVPLQSVTGKAGITTKRGRPFEQDGIIYLPTFHPAFILRDETQRDLFESDIKLFRDIVDAGEIPREQELNHKLVMTWKDVREMIAAMRGAVSFDIETTCLYPWQTHDDKGKVDPAKITMIGFGTRKAEYSLPIFHPESPWTEDEIDKILGMCTDALEECYVIVHGGKFDFLWMLVHYGLEWYKLVDFDTMMAHYILDENTRHGLKELAQRFCGAPDWDIDKDKKKGNTSLAQLGIYHGHDLHYTRKLKFIFGKMLEEDGEVKRVYEKIIMPCVRLFVEAEYDGIHVEVEKFDEAEIYLKNRLKESQKELAKYGKINWGSPMQVADLLFGKLKIPGTQKTKTGKWSTSESALNLIDHPCTSALKSFKEAKQQLSFFIDGWKPFLHRKRINGEWHYFLHPSFKLHGTVTGRLSCEHPNLQQVPRDERIRTLITAPPGWVLVECDLSQIELRIAAELASEPNMLNAFINKIDVHWLTALREIERGGGMKDLVLKTARTAKQDKSIRYAEAFEVLLEIGPDVAADIDKEWKELRKKAKAVNFGFLYGMWWKKFKIYARDNYGVEVTDEQAQAAREAFFSMYDFDEWHNRQRRYARRNGYVRSLSGRKRRLPKATYNNDSPERKEAERQAINSPVQSFANELNLMAALQLREEFGRDKARLVGTVHDAVLVWVKEEHVATVVNRLLEIMRHPRLLDEMEIELSVPIEAEAKVGPWGAGVSLEKYLKQKQRRAA